MTRQGVLIGALLSCSAQPALAQELTYRPINPAFGGNPFNADYLLGTATPQRPDRPATGTDGAEPLTEGELFARQIQSRLLSALSSSIVTAITGAQPGTSGEFTVGDQTIAFERTLTEIRLTIVDNVSGERTVIVVPVLNLNPGQGGSSPGQSAAGAAPGPGSGQAANAGTSIFSPSPLQGPPIEGGDLTSKPLGM